ncbi:MAG: 4-hydroxybenzoate octaprenyltransferase [Desulfobacteraceae bacterium 4572_35.1]|nr:MAG: 4-hydroxybenzoate octaprenyltransferase [Desulfobacteraceae bacterium 4572_35.1]
MAAIVFNKIKSLLEMIKFSHTVFAFPFALIGLVVASHTAETMPSGAQILWICLAMVGARSGAMGLNRLLDARIDALNPRTAERHIPAGRVAIWEAWLFVIVSFALLVFSAYMLNPLCFYLSPIALFFLALYSFAKRFTAYAHMVLGLCLGAAPVGAWIAVRGDISVSVVLIGLAVLLWVAGFDILYAMQDLDFDREHELHSIPAKLGEEASFYLVRLFHIGMIVMLLLATPGSNLGWIYLLGVATVAAMLFYEHTLVKPGDLSKMDAAFFTMNGYISVTLFAFVLLDVIIL